MNKEIAQRRLNEVVQVDTVTNSTADFLATHVPFRQIKLKHGGGRSQEFEPISEEDIWNSYVSSPGDRHQFIIVQGASGTGKSHLIRWLYTKFEAKKENLTDEAVMFIRRSDNSLKATIKQLLDLPETANLPNREIYERLAIVGHDINPQNLKDALYASLQGKVRADSRSGNTDLLTRNEKKKLYELLGNSDFQDNYIMQNSEHSPIERIYRRVAPVELPKGYNEELAHFQADDFKIDVDFLGRLEDDPKAFSFAEKLYDEPDDLPQRTADYLNQFVESVIQDATHLQPGDFEGIFTEIRQELYRRGKKLTLLIEDITSFTGVNEALLNVLTDAHTGTAQIPGQERCRLSSIVGTTTEFYELFRDNFKDRISEEIYIEDTALTESGGSQALFELAARYLNAMSLPDNVLMDWAGNGATAGSLPVHERTEESYWPTYTMNSGQELSLYPFTKNALTTLVAGMQEGHRTPRYFLTEVLFTTVQHILNGDPTTFPPAYSNIRLNQLQWRSSGERSKIIEQCPDEQRERLNRFVLTWGDRTANQFKMDGIEYLSGIPIPIYNEFGFPELQGIKEAPSSAAADQNATESAHTQTKTPESATEAATHQILAVKPPKAASSPSQASYQKQFENIEQWLNGGILADDRKDLRQLLENFVSSVIDWQAEGISLDLLGKIIESNKFLAIERCSRGTGIYTFPADLSTYQILDCLLKWRYLGNRSWTFEGAEASVYAATNWLYGVKDKIVESVINSTSQADGLCFYAECAVSASIECLLLSGTAITPSSLPYQLFAQHIDTPNLDSESKNIHSSAWREIFKYLKKSPDLGDTLQTAHDYFNIKQSLLPATKTSLQLTSLEKCLERLASNDYMVDTTAAETAIESETLGSRQKPMEVALHLARKLPETVKKEQDFLREKIQPVLLAFDLEKSGIGGLSTKHLATLAESTEKYCKAVRDADRSACVTMIQPKLYKSIKATPEPILQAAQHIATALEEKPLWELLPYLAQNHLTDLNPLLEILTQIDKSLVKARQAMPSDVPDLPGYISPLEKNREQSLKAADQALLTLEKIGGDI